MGGGGAEEGGSTPSDLTETLQSLAKSLLEVQQKRGGEREKKNLVNTQGFGCTENTC